MAILNLADFHTTSSDLYTKPNATNANFDSHDIHIGNRVGEIGVLWTMCPIRNVREVTPCRKNLLKVAGDNNDPALFVNNISATYMFKP